MSNPLQQQPYIPPHPTELRPKGHAFFYGQASLLGLGIGYLLWRYAGVHWFLCGNAWVLVILGYMRLLKSWYRWIIFGLNGLVGGTLVASFAYAFTKNGLTAFLIGFLAASCLIGYLVHQFDQWYHYYRSYRTLQRHDRQQRQRDGWLQ